MSAARFIHNSLLPPEWPDAPPPVALIATCRCGRQSDPIPDRSDVLAAYAELAWQGWRHDDRGLRVCPECYSKVKAP